MSDILVPVAAGELIDKLTILQLKLRNITDPSRLTNVQREYDALSAVAGKAIAQSAELDALTEELQTVNGHLWDVEDDIRACEARGDFGPAFVELARSVYRLNDRRADIKRRINVHTGSQLVEEKSYASWKAGNHG